MADKKITALTALGAGLTEPANDLLHIIDYSASPVNKKITIANLFNQVNTDTTIIGASKTFEVEHAAGTSVLEVLTNTVASTAEATVTVNKDEHNFVDFTVHSTGGEAISVDASADTVTINSDAIAALDFVVKGDTTTLIHADGGLDCVGIGTATLSGNYSLQVLGDGVVVDSTCDIATSTALTMDDTSVIAAGVAVYGIGIAPGTTIASVTNATTAVLSAATLATASNVTLTFIAAAGTGHALKSSGSLALQGYEEVRTSQGAATLSNAVPVHKLITDSTATSVALTLSDTGAVDGQLKHIYITARPNTTGTFLIHQTNREPQVALVLDNVGESISLIYDATSSNWIELSIAGLSGS